MKAVLLILILIGFVSCEKSSHFVKAAHIPSKIDTLTDVEIEKLVHAADSNLSEFKLRTYTNYHFREGHWPDSLVRQTAKRFKIDKSLYKADFDNNGYTDILAIGDFHGCTGNSFCLPGSLVVMNFANDSIQLCQLSDEIFFPLPVVPQLRQDKNSLPLITLHTFKDAKYKPVNLTYKNGGFVELTQKITSHTIEKVQFDVGWCDGNCSVFEIVINKNRTATFYAYMDNFKMYETDDQYFKTTISQSGFDDIFGVLDYINFENLQDNYTRSGHGGIKSRLTITYDGGKTKTINDYCLQGTYGLRVVYDHFYKLRFNQNWVEAKDKPKDIKKTLHSLL